jgi:hypothetical protein
MLEGPKLSQCLGSAGTLANGIRHLRDDDGRENSPPISAEGCQFRPGPRKDRFVVGPVMGQEEC